MAGRWPLAALLSVTLWGGSFVATKIALGPTEAPVFSPFGLVALRFALAGLGLTSVLLLRGGALLPRRCDRGRVLLLGSILAAHIGLQTYGLVFTLATHAAWIVSFTPVVIALGAQLFLKQRLSSLGWLGVGVACVGVLVLSGGPPRPDAPRVGFGDLLQLVCCFTWAAFTLLGARPVRGSGALVVTTSATGVAALLLGSLALATGFGSRPGWRELAALAYLGLLSGGAANLAWYRAQHTHGSQRTAAMLYLEPFVTLAVASLAGEALAPLTVLVGLVVLIGVWLVQRGTLSPRPDPG